MLLPSVHGLREKQITAIVVKAWGIGASRQQEYSRISLYTILSSVDIVLAMIGLAVSIALIIGLVVGRSVMGTTITSFVDYHQCRHVPEHVMLSGIVDSAAGALPTTLRRGSQAMSFTGAHDDFASFDFCVCSAYTIV